MKLRMLRLWKRNLAFCALGALALYTLFGFFALPALLRGPVLSKVSDGFVGTFLLDELKFNPFTFRVELNDFKVLDSENAGEVLGLQSAVVNFRPFASLWRRGLVFEEIRLHNPRIRIEVDPGGSLNLTRALTPTMPPAELESDERFTDEDAPEGFEAFEALTQRFPVWIEVMTVDDGLSQFSDLRLAEPFHYEIAALGFRIDGFHTDPEAQTPYEFVARTEAGTEFTWRGFFALFPLRSAAEVSLTGLEPGRFQNYLRDVLNFELISGVAGVSFAYDFAPLADPAQMEIRALNFDLQDLVLATGETSGHETFFTMPYLGLQGLSVDLPRQRVNAEGLEVVISEVRVRREATGDFNFQGLFEAPEGRASAPDEGSPTSLPEPSLEAALRLVQEALEAAWKISLDTADFTLESLRFQDDFADVNQVITFTDLKLSGANLSNHDAAPIRLESSGRVSGEGGSFALAAAISSAFDAVEMEGEVSGLSLPPFARSLAPALSLELTSGNLSTNFAGQGALRDSALMANLSGSLRLANVALGEAGEAEPMVSAESLSLSDIRFELDPLELTVGELRLTTPSTLIVREADGQLNLQRLLAKRDEATDSEAADGASTAKESPRPRITIGAIQITDGQFKFVENFLEPATEFGLRGMTLELTKLELDSTEATALNFRARADTGGTIELTGSLTPRFDQPGASLAISITSLGLLPTSTYAGNAIGYPILSGSLSSTTDFELDGTRFETRTDLSLNRFNLSRESTGQASIPAPIHLGISLLKDRNDAIALRRIAVGGDFSDPETDVRSLVVQAIVRIIVNVASRPFAFLGSMLGAEDQNLEIAVFAPGSATLDAEAEQVIDVLTDALFERPQLSLELIATGNEALDTVALQELGLKEALSRIAEEASEAAEQAASALETLGWEGIDGVPNLEALAVKFVSSDAFEIFRERTAAAASEASNESATEAGSTKPLVNPREARTLLLAAVEVTPEALEQLAAERLAVVEERFLRSGVLDPERLTRAEQISEAASSEDLGVRFELR